MLFAIIQSAFASMGRAMPMAALASVFTVAQAQDANVVTIRNFMFSPMSLNIKTGSAVTWSSEPPIACRQALCAVPLVAGRDEPVPVRVLSKAAQMPMPVE